MDPYLTQMAAAALVPVKTGDKIKFLVDGIGTGLYVKVLEIKNDFDGKGLNVALLSDETYIVLPANPNGEFEIKYYGTSTKRQYFCRREPVWTPEQREEVETKVYARTHKNYRGLVDGEKTFLTYSPDTGGTIMVKLKTVSNADLFDQLHYLDQYYPAP